MVVDIETGLFLCRTQRANRKRRSTDFLIRFWYFVLNQTRTGLMFRRTIFSIRELNWNIHQMFHDLFVNLLGMFEPFLRGGFQLEVVSGVFA